MAMYYFSSTVKTGRKSVAQVKWKRVLKMRQLRDGTVCRKGRTLVSYSGKLWKVVVLMSIVKASRLKVF